METEREIPCATCKSWNAETKKFSCKPHVCDKLNAWLQQNVPQLRQDQLGMEGKFSEESIPWVV